MLYFKSGVFLFVLLIQSPLFATEDIEKYLNQYFKGASIDFGYGSGISSNSPRVELTIHYCVSGMYYSTGQSCRPNIIAKGYQCTPINDSGQWQVASLSGVGIVQWQSYSSGPGYIEVRIRNDGVVVDPRGNSFNRVGSAVCQ